MLDILSRYAGDTASNGLRTPLVVLDGLCEVLAEEASLRAETSAIILKLYGSQRADVSPGELPADVVNRIQTQLATLQLSIPRRKAICNVLGVSFRAEAESSNSSPSVGSGTFCGKWSEWGRCFLQGSRGLKPRRLPRSLLRKGPDFSSLLKCEGVGARLLEILLRQELQVCQSSWLSFSRATGPCEKLQLW